VIVTTNGVITAVSEGTAFITASIEGGFTAICEVIVTPLPSDFSVVILPMINGSIIATPTLATAGTTIDLIINPNIGYRLKSDSLKYNGNTINGKSFVMPAEDVIIMAEFELYPFIPGALTFTVGSREALPGQSIEVPIRITNNPGLSGVELTITLSDGLEWNYNPATYSNASSASVTWPYVPGGSLALTGRPPAMGTSADFYFINVLDLEAFDFVGDGTLLTLKLRISEDAQVGDELTVWISVAACGNATGIGYKEYNNVHGIITVTNVIYGDIGDTGMLPNVNSVLLFLAWYNNRSTVINMANADVNGDGVVNVNDVLLLLAWYNDRTIVLGPGQG